MRAGAAGRRVVLGLPARHLVAVVLAAFFLAMGWPALAEPASAPPTEPILRIETGRHTAAITHLATDGIERFVATASLDKTVRIWDANSGVPIRTLRVPIGPGPEGALYSVAVSPDGNTLLATGYTGGSWGDGFAIYVFDPIRGTMKTRLAHLPELINDVAFSSDGAVFAAAFSGHNGLGLWDAKSGKLVAQDHEYGDIATSVAFAPDGALATASFDGSIRLYGADFALKAKRPAPSGRKPHSVAFSPDGTLLAVGYEDALAVDLLDASDLKPIAKADVGGIAGGNLASVGWLAGTQGTSLAAAGTARDAGGRVLVRLWAAGGRGSHRDIAVAGDSAAHLLGVKGGLLFAAADPIWGRIDEAGRMVYRVERASDDFRDIADGTFALSADGQRLAFGTR